MGNPIDAETDNSAALPPIVAYQMVPPPFVRGQLRQSFSPAPHRGGRYESHLLHKPNKPLTESELKSFTNMARTEYKIEADAALDFINFIDNNLIVSGRVQDAIESLEPGVHQFIKIELYVDEVPKKYADRRFSLLNDMTFVNFLDIEASKMREEKSPTPMLPSSYSNGGHHPLFAKPGWQPAGHFWQSEKWVEYHYPFVSHDLKRRLEDMKADPVRFVPVYQG
jgi:hypothetical protein